MIAASPPGPEAPALAGPPQRGKFFAGEHRHQPRPRRRGPQPCRRIGTVLLGGQPPQEPPDSAELVAGIRGAVLPHQPHRPPLQILPVYLLPAGLTRLPEQVRGGEQAHRLSVGVQGPPGLALTGQMQPERIHLHLERPRVQLPGHRRVPTRRGDSFTLDHRIRHRNRAREVPFTGIGNRSPARFERHENPSLPAVSAGKRAAEPHQTGGQEQGRTADLPLFRRNFTVAARRPESPEVPASWGDRRETLRCVAWSLAPLAPRLAPRNLVSLANGLLVRFAG